MGIINVFNITTNTASAQISSLSAVSTSRTGVISISSMSVPVSIAANTTYSTIANFSGLLPYTQYVATANITSGPSEGISQTSFTTSAPCLPAESPYLNITPYQTSATIEVWGLAGSSAYTRFFNYIITGGPSLLSSSYPSASLGGLSPGTSYSATVRIDYVYYGNAGTVSSSRYAYGTINTLPPNQPGDYSAYGYLVSKNQNTISVGIAGLDSNSNGWTRTYYFAINGGNYFYSASPSYTFSGLTAGTAYTISFRINYQYGSYVGTAKYLSNLNVTTDSARPPLFAWTYSVICAGQTVNLSKRDWDSLQTNLISVAQYKGKTVLSMSCASVGAVIRAAHYNDVAANIRNISGGIYPTNVSVGDQLSASKIEQLRTYLNAIA